MSFVHCCRCKTKFTEQWTKGKFYLRKDGNGYYSPEPPSICDWRWSYDGDTPQQEYTIESNVLIYRNIYQDPVSMSNCNCTNADGGQGQPVQQEPGVADEMGLIVKSFKGTWISESPNCANIGAEHRIQYLKIYQQNEEYRPYINEHWCGRECPGAPWPYSRRHINKINEFKQMIRRYNG
jgi:hypothetical protein